MSDTCKLGLTQDSDKCTGTSCLTCGWNPAVEAKRISTLRRYGAKALSKKKKAGEVKA